MKRHRPLLLAAVLASSACVIGAPPGFGDGDVWTIPLVGPLENDVLLVPVSVNDSGPYLFMIDPDSHVSSLDNALASELDLYAAYGPEETTEADTRVPTFYADVPKMEAGNLVVRNHKWRVHKAGTYAVGGRLVRGVLGGDIIADSLLFSIDRDAGLVQLAETGKLKAPAAASQIGFRNYFKRRIANVKINGEMTMRMHLDLGGRFSRLWPAKLKEANLPSINLEARLIDEYGTVQRVTKGAIAAKVEAAGESAQGVLIVPFGDRRLDEHDIDGALGQDFFSLFQVTADWHHKKMWLVRRTGDLHASAADRIKRWDAVFAGCKNAGCVTVSLAKGGTAPGGGFSRTRARTMDPTLFADPATPAPAAGPDTASKPDRQKPADPPLSETPTGAAPIPPIAQAPRFRVVREAEAPELAARQRIEVLLDAVNEAGTSLGLAKVQVVLRAGTNLVEGQLDPSYAGAANLTIIDISPLGRQCEAGAKCYWIQTKRF